MMGSSAKEKLTLTKPILIYLNIYDITKCNSFLDFLGIGLYHTSVQIFDTQFSFYPNPGVMEETTLGKHLKLRRKILLGECVLPHKSIQKIIVQIKKEYTGNSYDVFQRNCNHFTEEFAKKLFNHQETPNYLNRIARIGRMFRCFFNNEFVYGGNENINKRIIKLSHKGGKEKVSLKNIEDSEGNYLDKKENHL